MKLFGTKKELNMLEGPLLGKVFRFALPLMVTNLLQVLYNAADMIVAGMSGVEGAIGAIGTTGAFINLILNIFMGFSIGTNVVVARNLGKGDKQGTSLAVHSSLIVAAVSGLACMGIGLLASRPVLVMLGDQGHILELACLYTRIYFIGTPFIALSNFLIAIFRAKGDTSTPLYILTATGLLNVALNLISVLVFGMSVDGVALATVISNVASTVLLAMRLMKDTGYCRLELKKIRPNKYAIRDIIRDGIPAGIQGALFSLSNMLIQSSIIGFNNRLCPGGSDIIDGNAAGASLESFAYTATNSVYQASVTFTSQHYGARKYKRIAKVQGACYLATFIIASCCSFLLLTFHKFFIGLYVSAPMAVDTAMTRMWILILPYFTLAFMEVGSGILRGMGRSVTSTAISLIGSCVLRLVWIWCVVPLFDSIAMVYVSYPISWTLTALTHFCFGSAVRRRLLREQEQAEAPKEILETAE